MIDPVVVERDLLVYLYEIVRKGVWLDLDRYDSLVLAIEAAKVGPVDDPVVASRTDLWDFVDSEFKLDGLVRLRVVMGETRS